ncbi:DEAD/DEAH box helicase [Candidatus Micrarchaeota archaeon]|nr:DEAD/DEAH box helicase [Candidatus Micrarchaeota archaeon]
MKFKELGISSKTIDALESIGYDEATEVQEKAIPMILQGKEVIVRSKTGSGKTAAFGISLIELILKDRNKQGVIIAPTRELAIQITDELREIGKRHRMKIYAIYGGQSIGRQISLLSKGFNIVVGTPGRMLDHLRRGTMKLDYVNWVVLDEADLMLDMGFEEDINAILREINPQRQMLLFSATIDSRIKSISRRYMHNPEIIEVGSKDVEEITEKTIMIKRQDKIGKLIEILNDNPEKRALIFVSTKRAVEKVCRILNKNDINASFLHGDRTQSQREKTINSFKKRHLNTLVATDVASRGLHIEDVELIINFDPAGSKDVHKHRIGRTGRMGKKGEAITFQDDEPRNEYYNTGRSRRSYGRNKRRMYGDRGRKSGGYRTR